MSSFYTVIDGDTFESISRKQYGIETNDGLLRKSNPGATLEAGTQIIIPSDPSMEFDGASQISAEDNDSVSILIDGRVFSSWHEVRIRQSIDSMDAVELEAPFDPDIAGIRDVFRPFSYKSVTVFIGDEPLFVGVVMNVAPSVDASRSTVTLSAYSLPGVLGDCSASPTEFNGQNLKEIAESLAMPFGVGVEFGFGASAGSAFESVAIASGRNVLEFLSDLAKQRGLVINSSNRGTLRFWNSTSTVKTEALLSEGNAPLISVLPSFSQQDYYSHVIGLEPVSIGVSDGARFSVKNPHLKTPYRPSFFEVTDASAGEVKSVVDAKAARMFGNMVGYNVEVSAWRDSSGDMFEVNTLIGVISPSAMIYSNYELLVRSVTFTATANSRSSSLELILPGAFSSEIPEYLPWDE